MQLELCTFQVNRLHYLKAICLSKPINPIGLKVKKPDKKSCGSAEAAPVVQCCVSLASLELTTHGIVPPSWECLTLAARWRDLKAILYLKHTIFPSCFLQNKLAFSPEFGQITHMVRKLSSFFDLAFLASRLRTGKGSWEDEAVVVLLLRRKDQGHGLGSCRQINYGILLLAVFLRYNLYVVLGRLFLIPCQLFVT